MKMKAKCCISLLILAIFCPSLLLSCSSQTWQPFADAEITQIQWYRGPKMNEVLSEEEMTELVPLLKTLTVQGKGEEPTDLIAGWGGTFYVTLSDGTVIELCVQDNTTVQIDGLYYTCTTEEVTQRLDEICSEKWQSYFPSES